MPKPKEQSRARQVPELFGAGVSVIDIAKRLGISRQGVYYHLDRSKADPVGHKRYLPSHVTGT